MEQPTKRGSKLRRPIVVLVLGVAIGTMIMATPASAHFRASISHIWSHIQAKADVRYARGNAKSASLSAPGPTITTPVVLLEVNVTTPNKCAGVDKHRYLVMGSGFDFEGSGTSFARHNLSVDDSSIVADETFRAENLDAASIARANYAMEKVFTVNAGAHSFRLISDASTGDYQASRANLVVMDLGYSC